MTPGAERVAAGPLGTAMLSLSEGWYTMRSSPRKPDARFFWEISAEAFRTGCPCRRTQSFLERHEEHGDLVVAGGSLQRGDPLAAGPFVLGEVSADRPEELSERCWHRGTFRKGGSPKQRPGGLCFLHDRRTRRPAVPLPRGSHRRCLIRAGSFWSDGMALSRTPVPRFEGSLDSPRRSFTPLPSWLVRHWPRVV